MSAPHPMPTPSDPDLKFLQELPTALVALASVVPGISTAPAAAENAGPLGQCTVSVRNPAHAGNYIWAYAPWTCSTLPAEGGPKIYL